MINVRIKQEARWSQKLRTRDDANLQEQGTPERSEPQHVQTRIHQLESGTRNSRISQTAKKQHGIGVLHRGPWLTASCSKCETRARNSFLRSLVTTMVASCGQVLYVCIWSLGWVLSVLFSVVMPCCLKEGVANNSRDALGYDTRTFTPYIPKAGIILCSVGELNNIQATYEQF